MGKFFKKFSSFLFSTILVFIAIYLLSNPIYTSNTYNLNKSPDLDKYWAVYKNYTAGIEISFVPDWTYTEGSEDIAFMLDEPEGKSKYKDPSNLAIKIMGIYKGEKNQIQKMHKSLVDDIKTRVQTQAQKSPYANKFQILYEGEASINSVNGYMLNCVQPGNANHDIENLCLCITSPKNITFFIVAFYPHDDSYRNIYLNIISSIKFM